MSVAQLSTDRSLMLQVVVVVVVVMVMLAVMAFYLGGGGGRGSMPSKCHLLMSMLTCVVEFFMHFL